MPFVSVRNIARTKNVANYSSRLRHPSKN